jgi:hypothetical protein
MDHIHVPAGRKIVLLVPAKAHGGDFSPVTVEESIPTRKCNI